MKLRIALVSLIFFSTLGDLVAAQDLAIQPNTQQEPTKTSQELAKWIMGIVAERYSENEKIKRELITYDKTSTRYNMEENPPIGKKVVEEVYDIYGRNGQSMERLRERNGRPVKNSRPEISKLNFNEILLERFDFNLETEVIMDGRGYYIISFKPKEPISQLPFNNRLDEGINRMSGTLYIDMEKFYLRSLSGTVARFTKTFLIELREFELQMEQEEFEGIIVPKSTIFRYRYRVFFNETHERLEYSYDNRQKKTKLP